MLTRAGHLTGLVVSFLEALVLIVIALPGQTIQSAPLKNLRAEGTAKVNGGSLHYEVYGRGPVLVFLHAGLADSRMWDRQVDYFSGKYTVVRFDARGYGQSAPPSGPFVPADDLYFLLQFLRIDRAAVIGLSMGGTQAIDFAAAHPQAVSALAVIAGSPGWIPYSDALVRRTSSISAAAKDKGPASVVEGWLNDPMLAAARKQPRIEQEMRSFLTGNTAGILVATPLMRPPAIPLPKLSDIKVPTLIMVGDQDDPEVVARSRTMSREIPGAKEAIVRGTGHMVNLENPREFNRLLDGFLKVSGVTRP